MANISSVPPNPLDVPEDSSIDVPEDSPTCPICCMPIDDANPAQAVDHKVANAVSHYFHPDCMRRWVNHRQAHGQPITCPLDETLISGIGKIPFAPPTPSEFVAFIAAADHGDLAQIQARLANGNIFDDAHSLAVRCASYKGHLDVVQALLANRNISDNDRGWAVRWASMRGHLNVIQALLANGNISDIDHGLAVGWASNNGHFDVIQALLANRNISDQTRGTSVRVASMYGYLNVVQVLLANGNISDDDRDESVRWASFKGHLNVAEALKKKRSWIPIVAAATVATGVIAWIANRVLFAN